MKKLLGYIFSPIHYLFFGLFLLIFHPIQWLSLKLGGYSAHKKSVDILNFFLVSTYYLAGASVRFENKFNLPQSRSIIFIANHQSLFDIPPLIWHLRKHHAKFISKIELTKGIPSISFNLKYGGAANIDRKDPKQSIGQLLQLGQRMKQHCWSAVIFPEGTRTRNGKMKAFATAGVATLLKKVPDALIVPVAIKGSWEFTKYGSYPLNFGEKISFTVLQPIEVPSHTAEEVVKAAEGVIRNFLGESDIPVVD
ncbi:lysophospholipid acyltransferase family protein [Rubrolithibacter danxiaensis]|uniref:lysophospholipid acyltransferase family protein n=1 Tax=Rubrolithibacter danxiaensis TaxID=3390805 RepID=UPI003BF81A93